MPIEGTIVAHNSQIRGSGKERTSINVNCYYELHTTFNSSYGVHILDRNNLPFVLFYLENSNLSHCRLELQLKVHIFHRTYPGRFKMPLEKNLHEKNIYFALMVNTSEF